jgi:hypothetical protein
MYTAQEDGFTQSHVWCIMALIRTAKHVTRGKRRTKLLLCTGTRKYNVFLPRTAQSKRVRRPDIHVGDYAC